MAKRDSSKSKPGPGAPVATAGTKTKAKAKAKAASVDVPRREGSEPRKSARLVGVIHLPALPGSPRFGGDMRDILYRTREDARALQRAGFDLAILENFGDAPFFGEAVPAVTVSALTACASAARDSAPGLDLGINVLRNDAAAALAIAAVVGAKCVRVNVLSGVRVTDQGVVTGRAAELLRLRAALGAEDVALWADVDVKHAAPLAPRDVAQETTELWERSLADAVLVTGAATGHRVDLDQLDVVRSAAGRTPVYVASGVRYADLGALAKKCAGVIVGSALRQNGRAGGPIDLAAARAFADAFRRAFG